MVTSNLQAGSIGKLLDELLNQGYNNSAGAVLGAITESVSSGVIEQRLKELSAEAARLADNGEKLQPNNPVLAALLSDLDVVMQVNADKIANIAPQLEQLGINVSGVLTKQLALPGFSDEQLQNIGVVWKQVDPEAINNLVNLVDSPAFAQELAGFASDVVSAVANQAIRGQLFGWNPKRTAKAIKQLLGSFPSARANTLMRTLQLESYRTGTAAHQNANVEIIKRVIRVETLDDRICLACVGLHGEVVWDRDRDGGQPIDRIEEHHNGRGTTVVETDFVAVNIESGVDWFNHQPKETQLRLAGPAAFNALAEDAVQLQDFVGQHTDPLFGAMIYEQSLVGILGDGASQYYKRNQKEGG